MIRVVVPLTGAESLLETVQLLGPAQCLERCNHWFLVVWFDLTYLNNYNKPITTEVALDLGANPVVCTADNQDLLQDLDKPTFDVPTPYKNLLENDVSLKERVEFEVMRSHLLGYTWLLVHFASIVYLEDLTYKGMDKNFVGWARRNGVLDWHESWLPARLAASGIPMEKVNPRGTSRLCSRCQYPYGQRDRGLAPKVGRFRVETGLHPRRRTGGQVISGLDDTGPQTQPGAGTPDWSAAAFRCTA